jgi:heme o synthase
VNEIAARVAGAAGVHARWRLVAEIFKARIGLEITLASVAGVAMAGTRGLDPLRILVLSAGVFLASISAGALNHYAERDLDARMSRTRSRPFASGALAPGGDWLILIAVLLMAGVGATAWAGGLTAAAWVLLGAFTYGIVYTFWLKRRSWLNIVVGGLAGSFAVLAGAAAVDTWPGPAAWIFAGVLFLWTPPHFWSLAIYYRQDYAQAGVPMLPVVYGDRIAARAILAHVVPLVVLSLLPAIWTGGWLYLLCACAGGLLFLQRSIVLVRDPSPRNAIRNFLASLLQLGLLLLGAIVDAVLSGTLVG